MKVGDMVKHKINPAWSRGKIFSIIPGQHEQVTVLWGNGDIAQVFLSDIEPLGWNIHSRGHKN